MTRLNMLSENRRDQKQKKHKRWWKRLCTEPEPGKGKLKGSQRSTSGAMGTLTDREGAPEL